MKLNRIILIPCSFTLLFTSSCNSDDDQIISIDTAPKQLLKTITYSKRDIPDRINNLITYSKSDITFFYENDRLVKSTANDGRSISTTQFQYKENKIIAAKTQKGENFTADISYFYTNNLLEYYLNYQENKPITRNDFTYSGNKLIKSNLCYGEIQCSGTQAIHYSYTGNNISKMDDQRDWNILQEFTFGTSKNAFADMPHLIRTIYQITYNSLSENNVIQEEITFNAHSSSNPGPKYTIKYTYQFDENFFPVSVVGLDQNGLEYIKINYTYYK